LSLTIRSSLFFFFIRLAAVASQICEIREIIRKFELKALQGHPRSSILVPIESAYATSC